MCFCPFSDHWTVICVCIFSESQESSAVYGGAIGGVVGVLIIVMIILGIILLSQRQH
jgi:hypothetical protein